jgi:hypothetical protein
MVEAQIPLSLLPPDSEPHTDHKWPWVQGTSQYERKKQQQAYITAIENIDVLKLASKYNQGQACVEFGKRTHGSFNLCVFVEFPSDGTKWVVRFLI